MIDLVHKIVDFEGPTRLSLTLVLNRMHDRYYLYKECIYFLIL